MSEFIVVVSETTELVSDAAVSKVVVVSDTVELLKCDIVSDSVVVVSEVKYVESNNADAVSDEAVSEVVGLVLDDEV